MGPGRSGPRAGCGSRPKRRRPAWRSLRTPRPFLTGDGPEADLRRARAEWGVGESAVRVALHRLRRRFGAALREEVRRTVDEPGDVEAEDPAPADRRGRRGCNKPGRFPSLGAKGEAVSEGPTKPRSLSELRHASDGRSVDALCPLPARRSASTRRPDASPAGHSSGGIRRSRRRWGPARTFRSASARTASLSVLGSGGMGVVYLAEQEQPLRRRVALKLVKRGMDSKEVLARFESERQALALMDHPEIAQGARRRHDARTGGPYFVMEHVRASRSPSTATGNRLSTRAAAGAVRRGVRGGPARPQEGDHPPRHQAVERAGGGAGRRARGRR